MGSSWDTADLGALTSFRLGTLSKLHCLSKPDGQAKLKISTNPLIRVISLALANSPQEMHRETAPLVNYKH